LAAVFCATVLLLSPNVPIAGQRPAADAFSLFEKPTRVASAASGAKLALYCAGQGHPTVVLESGAGGNSAESWYRIIPLIDRRTRVCAYDRAGFGFSQLGADLPRDLNYDLADLHDVLHGGDDRGPFVLVGHSMGGTLAAAYADRYPEDVAGLVLIEPAVVLSPVIAGSSDSLDAAQRAHLREFRRCAARFANSPGAARPAPADPCLNSHDFDALSPTFARIEAEHRSTPDYWRALASEMESNWLGTISRQAAALLPHHWGSLPVRVVTAAVSEMNDSTLSAALGTARTDSARLSFVRDNHRRWEDRQAQLCSFSTDCVVTRVRTASHYVQIAAPDTVAALVNDLIGRVHRR